MRIQFQSKRFPSRRDALERARRSFGFTLVELLVVLTVMVSLGGILTLALASATTEARIKRTQADVLTIGQLLQSRVNEVSLSQMSLTYGRGGLELARVGAVNAVAATGPGTGSLTNNSRRVSFMAEERARAILSARRDLARLTMPECQADLIYPPVSIQFRTYNGAGWLPNVAQLKPPAQWSRMRTLAGLLSAEDIDAIYTAEGGVNSVNGATGPASNPEYDSISEAAVALFERILRHDATKPWNESAAETPIAWTREHESSECLYLILATTELFGQTAIDQIPSDQIEDTDGDGIPEILDAWGRPYAMLRNPISLRNVAIKNFDATGATPADQYPFDPDPFDFLAADFRYDVSTHPSPTTLPESAFFPVFTPPVVISAGRDGEFGIRLTYVNQDEDPEPEEGVNFGYSSSSIQFDVYGPAFPGIPIVRYPDPYFNVSSVASDVAGSYVFSTGGIEAAKTGGGLGATLDRDQASDNITSLDGGF